MLQCSYGQNHRVHRVAMATSWRTFRHKGKKAAQAGKGWECMGAQHTHPLLLYVSTITYIVVVLALAERTDTYSPIFLLYPCMFSVVKTHELPYL
jgi:hypothetical protein